MTTRIFAMATLAAIAFTSSCTALTPDLNGAPENSGLVIVECDVTTIAAVIGVRTSNTVVEGLIGGEGSPPASQVGRALGSGEILVFSGIKPGRWTFSSLRADWHQGSNTIRKTFQTVSSPEMIDKMTFEVRAGEPVYLGIVKIVEHPGFKGTDVQVTLEHSVKAEAESWQKMLAKYDHSPWSEPMRRKRASLAL